MQRLKDFCLKYKFWLEIAVISLFIMLCVKFEIIDAKNSKSEVNFGIFQILTIFLILVCAGISNVKECFCLSMFLSLFSGVGQIFIVGAGACLLSVIVRYIVDVRFKKKKIYILPLVLSVVLILLFSCIRYKVTSDGFTMGIMIIYVIVRAYLIFVYRDDIDVSKCFSAVFYAIVISLLIFAVFNDDLNNVVYDRSASYERLKLFSLHMNFLAMHASFQIAYSIYSIFNKKRNFYIDAFSILFSLICGIGTKSKAFLLIVAGLVLYSIICAIFKLKWKSIIYIVVLIGVVCLFVIFADSYIDALIGRFSEKHYGDNLFNRITTGRRDLWEIYINDWKSSPLKILFGVGMFSDDVYFLGTHNTYLFILYRFGVLGTILVISLIISYFVNLKLKLTPNNYIILCVWLLLALEEVVLSEQFAIYLFFGILLMLKDCCQTNKENVMINVFNDDRAIKSDSSEVKNSYKKKIKNKNKKGE